MNILELENLSKNFEGLQAVNNVSFFIKQGEITGVIGPNGAGKTTTFNLITGFMKPSKGKVLYRGEDITNLLPHAICKKGLIRTFQIVQTFKEMTVRENIMIGSFMRYPDVRDASKKADEIMDRLGISHKANQLGKNLTLHDCKRLEVARALATDPNIILLDEVMAGLNLTEVEDVIGLIRRLNQEGLTFLIIEHVMQAIMALSHKIVVLNYGEKIAEGDPKLVVNNKEVIKSYLGEEERLA
jgi:branched-chain amino acid transport system ATP-binding protein